MLSRQIATTVISLGSAGFSAEQLSRQKRILRECSTFLDRLIAQEKVSQAELLAFTRQLGP